MLLLILVTQAGIVVIDAITLVCRIIFVLAIPTAPPSLLLFLLCSLFSRGIVGFYGDSLPPQQMCSIRSFAASLFFCFRQRHVQWCTITTAMRNVSCLHHILVLTAVFKSHRSCVQKATNLPIGLVTSLVLASSIPNHLT